jgi:hypothetical protein
VARRPVVHPAAAGRTSRAGAFEKDSLMKPSLVVLALAVSLAAMPALAAETNTGPSTPLPPSAPDSDGNRHVNPVPPDTSGADQMDKSGAAEPGATGSSSGSSGTSGPYNPAPAPGTAPAPR